MKFDITITAGKIHAVLVLIAGMIAGLILENDSIVLAAIGFSSLIYGVKKHEERKMRESDNGVSKNTGAYITNRSDKA